MLRIVKDNAKSIHNVCKEVSMPLDNETKALLDEMLQYLKDSQNEEFRKKHPSVREGVGLAAPQVGSNKRMLVIYYPVTEEDGTTSYTQYQLVNPKIVISSVKKCYLEYGEGCLSVDKEHPGHVYRDYRITVKAYDALLGQDVEIKAIGYDAIVLQHEIDHLNGILFYDRIDKNDPMKVIPGSVAI
ncbi:MAG: peptide deformylase [Bacilli bacterium]|nr:peptide deformylase [Bacilli bacterium]